MQKITERLFSDDRIAGIIESTDIVTSLLSTGHLRVNEDYSVSLLNSPAFYEVYGMSFGEGFSAENGRSKVAKTGDVEDDLLYAVSLCLSGAKTIVTNS